MSIYIANLESNVECIDMDRYKADRYILYIRRSQDAEDRQVASLEDQEKEMREVASKLDLNIVDVLYESQSAKKPGRPMFNTMLMRIHEGEADGILCWKINRLARNPVDGGQIQWLLQQGTIRHIQTYSRDYQPSDNVIMMAVELGMANQFVNDLSVDVKRGMRQKAERGWYPQRSLPPGYKHNKGYQKGEAEILSTNELPIVRLLFDDMLTGKYSPSDIMRNSEVYGLTGRKGQPLGLQTIFNILTSEFYCGYYYWKDADGVEHRHRGRHEAILTEDEFNQVQTQLGKKGRPTRHAKLNFAFRGPLSCGECGSTVTAEEKKRCVCTGCKYKFACKTRTDCPKCGLDISEMHNPNIYQYVYYRCTKKNKDVKCMQSVVGESDLELQVITELSKVEISEDFYHWAVAALKHMYGGEKATQVEVTENFDKKRGEMQDRLEKLFLMRADGEISKEQLQSMKSDVEYQLRELENEQKRLHNRMSEWVESADEYLTFAEQVTERFNQASIEDKKEMLEMLGSKLELIDKKLRIVAPNELLGLTNVYKKLDKKLGRFETKKALEIQELFGQKRQAFVDLCAGMEMVRTRCFA